MLTAAAYQRCAHQAHAITAALHEVLAAGCSLVLIAGTTVPKDRADTAPAAIVAAGGEIIHFGMPVEPGNMLLLANIGAVPVIVLPGCARSRRTNGLDWVLQRILAGLPMAAAQIMAMGVGGLIRNSLETEKEETGGASVPAVARVGRRIGALVLAAGSGRRMCGGDKLLRAVRGVPMVRRVAAFDPEQPKIVVPMKAGLRGNPVIWPRAFFEELQGLEGDIGARDLLGRHSEQVEFLSFDDDAILADVDTPTALKGLAER